ncbi:MAG: YtxH domain-containing protein [Anaerolineales bacterium]|nr:YtxH domain-containing protein [Anaerolineales bacterium]
MSKQNSGTLFFVGLMTGGLVGAGLALLLTPQSGEETRSQLRDKSLELKEEAAKGLAEASQRAQEQAAVWQEKSKEVVEKGKQTATEAISRGKDSIIQAVSQSADRVVEAINPTEENDEPITGS